MLAQARGSTHGGLILQVANRKRKGLTHPRYRTLTSGFDPSVTISVLTLAQGTLWWAHSLLVTVDAPRHLTLHLLCSSPFTVGASVMINHSRQPCAVPAIAAVEGASPSQKFPGSRDFCLLLKWLKILFAVCLWLFSRNQAFPLRHAFPTGDKNFSAISKLIGWGFLKSTYSVFCFNFPHKCFCFVLLLLKSTMKKPGHTLLEIQ